MGLPYHWGSQTLWKPRERYRFFPRKITSSSTEHDDYETMGTWGHGSQTGNPPWRDAPQSGILTTSDPQKASWSNNDHLEVDVIQFHS